MTDNDRPVSAEERLLRDALDHIEGLNLVMAALRVGGRTPEKGLRLLDRTNDVPSRLQRAIDSAGVSVPAEPGAPDPPECGICGDYSVGGVEVHDGCLAELRACDEHRRSQPVPAEPGAGDGDDCAYECPYTEAGHEAMDLDHQFIRRSQPVPAPEASALREAAIEEVFATGDGRYRGCVICSAYSGVDDGSLVHAPGCRVLRAMALAATPQDPATPEKHPFAATTTGVEGTARPRCQTCGQPFTSHPTTPAKP